MAKRKKKRKRNKIMYGMGQVRRYKMQRQGFFRSGEHSGEDEVKERRKAEKEDVKETK